VRASQLAVAWTVKGSSIPARKWAESFADNFAEDQSIMAETSARFRGEVRWGEEVISGPAQHCFSAVVLFRVVDIGRMRGVVRFQNQQGQRIFLRAPWRRPEHSHWNIGKIFSLLFTWYRSTLFRSGPKRCWYFLYFLWCDEHILRPCWFWSPCWIVPPPPPIYWFL